MPTEATNDFIDGVALIGFRLFAESETPDLYTLITYGVEDIPLCSDGKLIFFSSVSQVGEAYALFDDRIKRLSVAPVETSLILDVSDMADAVSNGNTDIDAKIINCLNILFDLLDRVQAPIPDNYRKALYAVADHLTFDPDLAGFLKTEQISRQDVLDGVSWCIGRVVIASRLLR